MVVKGKKMTKGGLQIRMTVFVTVAVLSVSLAVLSIIAAWVRKDYEKMVNDRISDDLSAITRIMEQKLVGIEVMTKEMAALAHPSPNDEKGVDSMLCRSLKAMEGVQGVAMVFDKGWRPQVDGYYERYAYYDDSDGRLRLASYVNGDELDTDSDWNQCYIKGDVSWGEISADLLSDYSEISFFVPLNDKGGRRIGMLYSAVLVSDLTSFVTEYKTRKDIDISIYKEDGTMVVAPDDYILELSSEDMIVQESKINRIGWKVVLSADKNIINSNVRKGMLTMLLLFILMFIVIALAIKYTIRYVANPFVEERQRIEREKAVMENEMQLAAGAQKDLLPHAFPPFPDRKGIDLSACLHPARTVGGDLYDYFIVDNKLYICIGDVSGKGMQASLFMSATHYLFRSAVLRTSASDAASQINISLCADNVQCRFVTFWMGCLDLCSGRLEYVNAGHDSPLLVRNGRVEPLPPSENMPLGVWDEAEYVPGILTLMPGDALLLYTDGVTEAMDADGHEFGRERLLEAIADTGEADVQGLIGGVLDKVRQHTLDTPQSDDLTMLCLKFITYEGGFYKF